mmetsp:Transcript_32991/g.71403  ORF Transcript_32991/g.71403 Transcript_32991/m.71403 type:complete len:132 (-) Transcript_32991:938-1333(-)
MSQKVLLEPLSSRINKAFKEVFKSSRKHLYLGKYIDKWLPDTTCVAIIKTELGLDSAVCENLLDYASFNNSMSSGYKGISAKNDEGKGVYKEKIKMKGPLQRRLGCRRQSHQTTNPSTRAYGSKEGWRTIC